MTVKRRPHHDLAGLKTKFATVDTLEITTSALRSAEALGYDLEAIVDVVQQLETGDFVKSETAHSRETRAYGTTATVRRSTAMNSISSSQARR